MLKVFFVYLISVMVIKVIQSFTVFVDYTSDVDSRCPLVDIYSLYWGCVLFLFN